MKGIKVKLPKIKIPFPTIKKILGVDIGTESIKIVELERTKNEKWTLKKCAFESLGSLERPPEEKKALLINRLKEIVLREKFSTKMVATSLSGNQVIVRYVKFPKLTPEDLAKTISFEAEAYIPFDIKEVNLAFYILGDVVEEGEKKMETVVVAVKKDVIQNRIEILDKAGLEPAIIDIDAFAIENALELIRQPETKETVVVVNLGASVTNLAIIEKGVCKVVRDIFIAGNTFTKVIQQNLNVDLAKAEELKRKYGLSLEAEEEITEKAEVSKALLPVVGDLLKEVQHSIDYYQTQLPEELPVNRVILSGGTAQLPNLGKYFAQELQMPVEICNPFAALNIPLPLSKEITEKNSSFTIAVGLSSRRE